MAEANVKCLDATPPFSPVSNTKTKGDPGKTIYTVSTVEEITDGKLIIRPTLDWYVQDDFKHTDIVKRELEHVSRDLWWQSKDGDGGAAVRKFNRNPSGIKNLKAQIERARFNESVWQTLNIHRNGRHSLDRNPAKAMDPAEIRKLIENVRPIEEPFLGN